MIFFCRIFKLYFDAANYEGINKQPVKELP